MAVKPTGTVDLITITARGSSTLTFKTAAKEVYLVAGSDTEQAMGVTLDSTPISQTDSAGEDVKDSKVLISTYKLYKIVSNPDFAETTLTITVPDGVTLNAFTFGS